MPPAWQAASEQVGSSLRQRERHDAGVHRHRNILPSAGCIRHGRGMPARVQRETPYPLAALRVQRPERTVVIAEEYQATGGGQQAAPGLTGAGLFIFPGDLSRLEIKGADIFSWGLSRYRAGGAAVKRLALLPPFLVLAEDIAPLQRRQIKKPGAGMISGGHPVGCAFHRRAYQRPFRRRLPAFRQDGTSVRANLL